MTVCVAAAAGCCWCLLLLMMMMLRQGPDDGGGVLVVENFQTQVTVSSSVFEGNYGLYGGAMSLYDSDVTVQNCSFYSNEVRQLRRNINKQVWARLS
jgi:hypothetical protein